MKRHFDLKITRFLINFDPFAVTTGKLQTSLVFPFVIGELVLFQLASAFVCVGFFMSRS
jgi:hypothetical protein